ncbi:sensor domain-containing protein [Nocardioides ungokensis]|uniref:sensor domain-containing protein n=1 Tax=Nocardioides ungokensis TaxID=1643322 RepID=UPI0015DF75AA|nr:bifunctional diguanylate cyclase/phosphodiesterase [Nocardioides ungokensis]
MTPDEAGLGTDDARPLETDPTRFRRRFDQTSMPQSFCDLDGVLTEVNDAYCRLVDRPGSELVGMPVRSLNHRSDSGDADAHLAALLRGEIDSLQTERILCGPAGRPVPVLVDAALLRDEDGRPLGAAAFVQDLSSLRGLERRRQQQEDFFLALAQRASDLAIVTDAEGRLLYASPALTGMLGYATEDVIYSPGADFVHEDDVPETLAMFARVVAHGGAETITLRVRDAAGVWHWMEETASNLLDTAVGGIVCNLRDITDRVRAEAALRASESRYRAIADNAEEGLWVTAPDGRSVYVNSRMVEILGLTEGQVLGRSLIDVLHSGQRRVTRTRTGTGGPGTSERYEVTYDHPDGRERILSVSESPLDDADGAIDGSLAMVSDITDARRLEDELRRAALHDTLTGLPNRALLLDRLQHALTLQTRGTAVMFVDLDRFKIINDARGHAAGDELLIGVAARLRSSARAADTVARFGGDEFLVVCEDVDEHDARAVALDLLQSLDQPFQVAGGEAMLSASIGVALSSSESADALLSHADTAMYAAKVAGRSRIRVFDAALAAQAEERFELGSDLRRALLANELELHYQPVIDLATGQVLGAEALARWTHRLHGPVPPDRFVAVAEDVGLAARLDRWALRLAAHDTTALRRAAAMPADAYVAVNVSARTLSDPGLEDWITWNVEAAGLTPADVLIEVTESAIMTDATYAVALLTRLRQRGFGVAVDDFGTGHSSLAYLRDLPLTVLKIDRSFVAELTDDASARAIAASIIELARAVGVTVVAEGVEKAADAELLRGLGCDAAQGWLWSPAVHPAEAHRSGALSRTYDVSA